MADQSPKKLSCYMKFYFSRFILFICCSFPVHADNLSELYAALNKKLSNPSLLKEAMTLGKDRATYCKYCHGDTGNSKRGYIPNLAGQNSKYLLHQFELFASNQRKDKVMSKLVSNLSNDERINIALYYASQKVTTHADSGTHSNTRTEQIFNGKSIFNNQCAHCHGLEGHGQELLPRIAGQPITYLNKTLRRYRNYSSHRPDSPMQEIATNLSQDDLTSVVHYISTMK